jgi:CubicO group peptidase (beta-lactamase class C family)
MAAQQFPPLSLAVLQSGKLVFAQGYGLANLELAVKADERNAAYANAQWNGAPNGLVSSVLGMARWDAALTDEQVLSFSLLQQMWESTILTHGKIAEYGLAWKVEQHQSGKLVSHTGGGPICLIFHVRFLDAQVSIILLANQGGTPVWNLGWGIAERFLLSDART